jgi:DNA-binding transcriptional ArsR family regulator
MPVWRGAVQPGDDVFLIDDLETLRLLTQPLRLRLLEALRTSPEPLTVKELAADLGTPQTRLYHHVNLLEEHGLIRVAQTRLVSGITEKRYAATAARIGVDRSLLAPAAAGEPDMESLDVLLSVVLDEARSEIRRAVQAGLIDLERSGENQVGPRQLVLGRKWFRFTEAQLAEFEGALKALSERFADQIVPLLPGAAGATEAQLYELLLGFFPAVSPAAPGGDRPGADGPSQT